MSEPSWFYDLHGVARTLIADHGHGPLWLADYLSTSSRHRGAFLSIAETDLIASETRKRLAEADLIAVRDGKVLTAEVKTSNSLGRSSEEKKRAAEKRIRWASLLRADEIVLATTQTAWDRPSVSAVRVAMNDTAWAPGHAPRLHLVVNLGDRAAASEYVNP